MSYDLAVWEGDRPANDFAAAAEFERLYDRYIESDELVEPTARIVAYATALLDRYPDIGTDAGADSPWSTSPLMSEASGRWCISRWCGADATTSRPGRRNWHTSTD